MRSVFIYLNYDPYAGVSYHFDQSECLLYLVLHFSSGRAVYPFFILPLIVPSYCTQLCARGILGRHYLIHSGGNHIDMTSTHIYDVKPQHMTSIYKQRRRTIKQQTTSTDNA